MNTDLYVTADEQVDRWFARHAHLGTLTGRDAYPMIAYRRADEIEAYADARRPVKASRKVRKNLYAAFVDSLDFPTLEDYGFERAVAADRITRKPRNPRDLILSV